MIKLPDFPSPNALGDGRFWSAEFESVDPREDNAYWWVTLTESDGTTVEFFSRLDVFGPVQGDAARADLQRRVAALAARGATNTTYLGSTMWQRRRRKLGL